MPDSLSRPASPVRRDPPRLPGLPLLGNGVQLLRDPLATLRRAHASLGPVFELTAPGRRIVVLAGPDANRFAGREGRDALLAAPFWGPLVEQLGAQHNILASDGPDHLKQRRLFGDVLSKRAIDNHRDGLHALIDERFLESCRAGASVSLTERTRLLIARCVHHATTRGQAPIDTATATSLMEAFRYQTNVLLLGKWPKLALHAPSYRRHSERSLHFLDALLEREVVRGEAKEGWFKKLRDGAEKHPELFGPDENRANAVLPFVAGVDTVGATLAFVLAHLSLDPALWDRVAADARQAFEEADGVPSAAELKARPALHGVVLEALRRYPSAFGMFRVAARPFEFGGYEVEEGREVLVFTSSAHFDESYFPAPDRFDIDRAARGEMSPKHVFMPYGAGPHICLGAGMGEALLLLAVATIVLGPRLDAVRPGPPRYVFDPSLTLDPSFRTRVGRRVAGAA